MVMVLTLTLIVAGCSFPYKYKTGYTVYMYVYPMIKKSQQVNRPLEHIVCSGPQCLKLLQDVMSYSYV